MTTRNEEITQIAQKIRRSAQAGRPLTFRDVITINDNTGWSLDPSIGLGRWTGQYGIKFNFDELRQLWAAAQ